MENTRFLTVSKVSELTGYAVSYIYKLTMDKKIPYSKFGKRLIFKKDLIDKWIEDNTIDSSTLDEFVTSNLKRQSDKKIKGGKHEA